MYPIHIRLHPPMNVYRAEHVLLGAAAMAFVLLLSFYVQVLNEQVERGARLNSAHCVAAIAAGTSHLVAGCSR